MAEPGLPHHDRFFRRIFSRPDAAATLVREYLPPDVVEALTLETLEIWRDSYVDAKHREHVSDVVYRVRLKEGGGAWIYVLVEHESGPDELVALQLLRYVTAVWERHVAEGGGVPLPLVIPLVIHHGRRPWKASTELADLLQASEALAPFVPRLQYLLVDLRTSSDDDVRGDAVVRTAFLAMRHIFDQDLAKRSVGIVQELRGVTDPKARHELVRTLAEYLWGAARRRMKGMDLFDLLARAFPEPEGEELMHRVPQDWIDEGIERGAVGTAREDILEVLELRFGTVPAELRDRIEAIEELEALRKLHRAAVTESSMGSFLEKLSATSAAT